MEAEAVRRGCPRCRHRCCAVPAVAPHAQTGCVVPQHGHARTHWFIFRHGDRPPYSVHHHDFRSAPGSLALS